MSTFLVILGSAALVASALLTLLMAAGTSMFTMRAPSGPDAMGLAGIIIGIGLAWLLALVGGLVGVWRGAFDWMPTSTGVAALIVIAVVLGLGAASMTATMVSMDLKYQLRTLIGLSCALVMPLVTIMFFGALLWGRGAPISTSRWPWFFGIPLATIAATAWIGIAVAFFRIQQQRAIEVVKEAERQDEQRRQHEAQQAELDVVHAAELAALPDDTSIHVFVTHLFINRSDAHHARAIARMATLPNLLARLEGALADPDPLMREYVANYIRACPTIDPALAPAIGRAILLLAADLRRLGQGEGHAHAKGLCVGMMKTAARFEPARFDGEARELRAAASEWPDESTRAGALEVIDQYLATAPTRAR